MTFRGLSIYETVTLVVNGAMALFTATMADFTALMARSTRDMAQQAKNSYRSTH